MKFGIQGVNNGPISTADSVARVAILAEELGYESIWTGEHLLLPDPYAPPAPVEPECRFVDSVATLAFMAALTKRIKLGSGIILLSQRDPVVLAKELAGVDVLSKGRLLFGLGVGYVPAQFEALGIPYEERGARTTEHIEVLRTLWSEPKPSFDGEFTKFSGIQSNPRPVQQPHPPIIVGGDSQVAFRRAVAQGNGWYGWHGLEGTVEVLKGLEKAAQEVERPESLGPLEISVCPTREEPGITDMDTVKQYEDLGVDRLVFVHDPWDASRFPSPENEDAVVRFIEEQARPLGLG